MLDSAYQGASTTPADRVARLRARLGGLAYGGDYNPEQWPADVWDEDVRLMTQAGVGMVTVGVFSWSVLEPSEGVYDFGWLDDVLDRLHTAGIAVDLATPNAAPPPWLAHSYPETLLVERDGTRVGIGSRGHFCPSSPVYRDRSLRIARLLAERYGDHPALAMWHVGNEYHAHCHCDLCDAAFREWLRGKYGDLRELNRRWGTTVWSQRYDAWAQVHLPRPVRGQVNPARVLDFARFVSDVQLGLFTRERDLLHALTSRIPVTTNFFQNLVLNDYQRWGREVNIVSFDSYPDPGDPESPVMAALHYDLMRSIGGGRPWLAMEQAAGAVSQWRRNYAKPPGGMRLDALRMIARGSDAAMFFQWRAAAAGQEKFHSAMLPHGGTSSRTWREVEALGAELPRLAEVVGSRVEARTAIVWDWENWWAVEGAAHPVNDLRYLSILARHYAPLWRANVATDVVTLDADLSRYRVLVIPNQYLISAAQQAAVERFVSAGGHVLISYFSGIVDPDDRVIPDGYPGGLRRIIGGHVRDVAPLPPGTTVPVSADGAWAPDLRLGAEDWQDDIVAEAGAVLARYAGGDLAGAPAILDNRLGEGSCVYLGTRLDDAAHAAVTDLVLRRGGIRPPGGAAPGVEITRRTAGERSFTFMLNGTAGQAWADVEDAGVDLLTGVPYAAGERIALGPRGIAVLDRRRCGAPDAGARGA